MTTNHDTTSVQPGTGRWAELVEGGIARDAARNWYLGDAALEIAPMGADGAHNGAAALLDRYAEEVGIKPASLRAYRDVASAWPRPNRIGGTSWRVHQYLMGEKYQHLIRPGMTLTEAAAARGHSNIGRTGPQAPAADRAKAAASYLEDPEVARQAFAALPLDRQAELAGQAAAALPPLERAKLARQAYDREARDADRARADAIREELEAGAPDITDPAYLNMQAQTDAMAAITIPLGKALTLLRPVPEAAEALGARLGAGSRDSVHVIGDELIVILEMIKLNVDQAAEQEAARKGR